MSCCSQSSVRNQQVQEMNACRLQARGRGASFLFGRLGQVSWRDDFQVQVQWTSKNKVEESIGIS